MFRILAFAEAVSVLLNFLLFLAKSVVSYAQSFAITGYYTVTGNREVHAGTPAAFDSRCRRATHEAG